MQAAARADPPRRRHRGQRADPGRERHRQGAGRARDPLGSAPRRSGRSSPVNCGAIPDELIESRAVRPRARAPSPARSTRQATACSARPSGGTLFLDEIGELPLGMQVKLLRVLQEREVRPRRRRRRTIDGRHARRRRDQPRPRSEAREQGTFREDLYYRLNVITIRVPPLRERREDIALLAEHFMRAVRRASSASPMRAHRARTSCEFARELPLARQRARAAERDRARRRSWPSPTS